MAPSATENRAELPSRPVKKPLSHVGAYKELATSYYDKEAELKGKDGLTAAQVCPTPICSLSCIDICRTC